MHPFDNIRISIICLIILTNNSFRIFGQEYYNDYRYYPPTFFNQSCRKALMDGDGYVWFLTNYSLRDFYLYDGKNIKTFNIGLAHSATGFREFTSYNACVRLDREKMFWVGSDEGLYGMKNGQIHWLLNKQNAFASDTILVFEPVQNGMWVLCLGGISLLKKTGDSLEIFHLPDLKIPEEIRIKDLYTDRKLFTATINNDLYIKHYPRSDGRCNIYKIVFRDPMFDISLVSSLPFEPENIQKLDHGDGFVVHYTDKYFHLDLEGELIELDPKFTHFFGQTDSGQVFMSFPDHRDSIRITRGEIQDFYLTNKNSNNLFLYSEKLPDLYYNKPTDKQDLWIRDFMAQGEFIVYPDRIQRSNLCYPGYATMQSDGNLWTFNFNINHIKYYKFNKDIIIYNLVEKTDYSTIYDVDENGNIYIYTYYWANNYFDDEAILLPDKFKIVGNERKLQEYIVDESRNLWVSGYNSYSGDYYFEKIQKGKKVLHLQSEGIFSPDSLGNAFILQNDTTLSLYQSDTVYNFYLPNIGRIRNIMGIGNRRLLLRTDTALYCWANDTLRTIDLRGINSYSLISDKGYRFLQDKNRKIAMIRGDRIILPADILPAEYTDYEFSCIDKFGRIFFLKCDENDMVHEFLMLEDGRIRHLKFSKPVYRYKNYLFPDNLTDNEHIVVILDNQVYIYDNGSGSFFRACDINNYMSRMRSAYILDKLYLSGWGNHIMEIDLDHFTYDLPVVRIRNISTGKGTYYLEDTLAIKTKEQVSFNYFCDDEYIDNHVLYQTMLEGWDEGWSEPKENNNIQFTNLTAGNYTFKVRSIGLNDVWSDPLTYNFTVNRRWYQTAMAFIIYGTLLLIFIQLVVRISIYRIKAKNIILEARVKEKSEQVIRERAKVEEMKNRFYTNISHEFRTPLTLINGNTEQLAQELSKPLHKKMLTGIRRASNHLLKLVNEMLDLTRLEAGKFKLSGERSNIVDTIKLVWQMYISEAERRGIKYSCNFSDKKILFWHDKGVLEKILHNLISNALKFTEQGGSVHLQTDVITDDQSDPDQISISIKDTGIGIPADQIEKVFDRFYQADHKSTRITTSSGIGLALVRELVELHKGTIEVHSDERTGTLFILNFPLKMENVLKKEDLNESEMDRYHMEVIEEEPEFVAAETKLHNLETGIGRPEVLVVEDNNDLRNHISNILRDRFRVFEAENGKKGLDLALEKIPALIVSDVMMPEMDGEEMCRQIKTNSVLSHIPVILLTAKADKKSKIAGLELGADDYITKPFDRDELIVRIRNLIDQRSALKQKFSAGLIRGEKELTCSTRDDQLIEKIIKYIYVNIDKPVTNVKDLCREVGMSQPNLYRKIKAITNYTPTELIRFIKIKHSIPLLESGNSVSEAAYASGFNSVAYYSKSFKMMIGTTPGNYRY